MEILKDFINEIENRILVYDGSKGYLLQKLGLKGGECGELWNITKKDAVKEIYRQYREAGSDVLQTNTFPGNRIHLEKYSLGDKTYEINYWGTKLAREVAGDDIFVAASIGPTGILFEPSGELTFDQAYDTYSEQIKAVADGGADIINFETFTDVAEMRAALLAARETVNLPVICSIAFENNGHTLMGSDPYVTVAVLKALGADMVGTSCSFGAQNMLGIVKEMYEAGGGYLSVKPNAGLPEMIDGKVFYKESAQRFAEASEEFVRYGARLIGGCCGSTPEFIQAIKSRIENMEPMSAKFREGRIITSGVKYVLVENIDWSNIGRLDAGTDNKLLAELKKNNLGYIEDRALDISIEGYDAVYINVDAVDGGDDLLAKVINMAQGYVKEPFIIETANAAALEMALRKYKGIAGVVLPANAGEQFAKAVKKYGSEVLSHFSISAV